jgi:hypothetical protein
MPLLALLFVDVYLYIASMDQINIDLTYDTLQRFPFRPTDREKNNSKDLSRLVHNFILHEP